MDSTDECLKLWRDKILESKRKELSPGELSSLFQQIDLQQAFFKIIDRDCNQDISLEEWTGCFSKLLGDADPQVMNWFVDKFNNYCNQAGTVYLNQFDFSIIVTDIEFGYRFASIISPKSRRVNTLHLLSSLEIIASMSTDAKWLSWLKYQFTEAMIKSNRMHTNELHVTLDDFLQNFHFKEEFLAKRLFNYLDKDQSGTLTLREFIDGLEVVVNGNQEEKMEFLFKVFDIDNDGHLDYEELRMMLKCCLENTPSLDMEETVDDLAAALFKDTDKDDSGDISLEELKNAFKRHESLYKTLSVSTSIWIKPKFINKKSKQKWHNKLKDYIMNNRAHFIFWSAYIFIHILCSVVAYWSYRKDNIYVICARICGNGLNFNCSLILVLVLRKHFTWIRSKGGAMFLPIDDFIQIHKIIGIIILIETLIHTAAHFKNLHIKCLEKKPEQLNFFDGLFTLEVNTGFPTGFIELFLLFIILIFAMSFVRNRGYFQVFYWFHSLTIPFLIIMLSHGLVFWRWILVPGFLYMIEKIMRYRKVNSNKFGDTYINEAFVLPSKVVYLVIRRPPKFHFKPGDYIFINIPSIANYEWHPFSISSAPENSEYIWLHIRAVGNWTKRLYQFSSSPNFELGCSFSSQRSMARTVMRARMSKVYKDDSHILEKSLIKKFHEKQTTITDNCNNTSNNKFLAPNVPKKAVSFEKNINLNVPVRLVKSDNEVPALKQIESIETNTQQQEQQQQQQQQQIKPVQAPARHKGILKSMNTNQGSFNYNETINSDNLAQENEIVESTPKIGENKTSINNVDNLALDDKNDLTNHNISTNTHPKLGLINKNSPQFKSIDSTHQNLLHQTDYNNQNKFNLANEYFADKEKKSDAQIVLNLNENSNKNNQENCVILFDKNNNDSIESNNNEACRFYGNYNKNFDKNNNEKEDVLGYLKMYQKANRVNIESIGQDHLWRLQVLIDGPYGTPSQDIFDSEHAVLIAAGIGITPFASILQSLMHKYKRAKANCPNCSYKLGDDLLYTDEKLSVKKVDFIWVTREQRSLEWFISMLSQMEIEQRKNDDMFLETHLYVTSAKRQSDLRSIGLHLTLDAVYSHEESSLIEGLRQRTHYGRPNWDILMQNLIRKQKGKINVFYCGLASLANILQSKCNEYGLAFKKEVF